MIGTEDGIKQCQEHTFPRREMKTFDLRKGPWILLILVVLLSSICDRTDGKVAYQFKQHYYRKKPKVEKRFKLARKLCLNTEDCQNLHGQDLSKCLRLCLAPSCYEEIYGDDELEVGEIDVRANSFKGCWLTGLPIGSKMDL